MTALSVILCIVVLQAKPQHEANRFNVTATTSSPISSPTTAESTWYSFTSTFESNTNDHKTWLKFLIDELTLVGFVMAALTICICLCCICVAIWVERKKRLSDHTDYSRRLSKDYEDALV